MKFSIQRETILRAIQQVFGVVERRQTLPVLSNFLFMLDKGGISITATDLEVELIAHVEAKGVEHGEFTLPARKFMDICRALPEEARLDLQFEQDRCTIRSGRSRFTLSTLPVAEFPTIDDIRTQREFNIPQKGLRRLIERTHFCMAMQDVRYYLNGLLLELRKGRMRTVATDGHRLALCEAEEEVGISEDVQVIVPRKGIQELMRLLEDSDEMAKVQLGSNHIRVALPGIQFTSKLIDGRFPDYQRVLPKGGNKVLLSDREVLRQALTRTSILSNEKYRGVRLTLNKDSLSIQAHNPEQEEAEEEIEVSFQGDGLEIGFNVNYLIDAIGAIDDTRVQISLSDANSSCIIQGPQSETCKYVVMPMRL